MATYNCKYCGRPFNARPADRRRGWALFCSKAHSASWKNKRGITGMFRHHDTPRRRYDEDVENMGIEEGVEQ